MSWHEHGRPSENVDDRRTNINKQQAQPVTAKTAAKVGLPALLFGGLLAWCVPQAVDVILPSTSKAPEDAVGRFVANILGDNEDRWRDKLGDRYRPPKLTLYTKSIANKDCGQAKAAYGPFYCEEGERIFLDVSFFGELNTKACKTGASSVGAACEFARAHVIAHEHGHHIQKLLGIFATDRGAMPEDQVNVRTELQADCFAGLWAGWTNTKWKNLTPDLIVAGQEVAQFGGDGPRGPPSHGTSAQRAKWFMQGYAGKELASCDTFAGEL